MSPKIVPILAALLAFLACPPATRAQGTAFTYQGQLLANAAAANGSFDLQLTVYDATTNGSIVAGPLTIPAVAVTNGLFTVTPDFGGNVFTGPARWLQIAVRTNGGGVFAPLTARQPLTPAPYALYAPTAGNVTGTLAVSNLPASVALLNGSQTFTGAVRFANPSNSYSGTFAGNGSAVTNVPFTALNSGSLITWTGHFWPVASPPTGSEPMAVASADFNGDGWQDLVCVDYADFTVIMFTNNGRGGFAPASTNTLATGAAPLWVAAADVNGDGRPDIITANYGLSTITILTNNGSNGFTLATNISTGTSTQPYYVVAADINGDGRTDLIVANYSTSTLSVFTNNGAGVFALASAPSTGAGTGPIAVAVADMNGDGRPDLISANYNTGTLSILTNAGNGQFVLTAAPSAGTYLTPWSWRTSMATAGWTWRASISTAPP